MVIYVLVFPTSPLRAGAVFHSSLPPHSVLACRLELKKEQHGRASWEQQPCVLIVSVATTVAVTPQSLNILTDQIMT